MNEKNNLNFNNVVSEISTEVTQKSYLKLEHSSENWVSRAHYHNAWELIVPLGGASKCYIDGESYDFNPDQILFIDSFEVHYFELEKGSEYIACRTNRELLSDFFEEYQKEGQSPRLPRILANAEANGRIKAILTEWLKKEKCTRLQVRGYINLLYAEIATSYELLYQSYSVNKLGIALLEYIHKNFKTEIGLDTLARHFGYSRNTVSRVLHSLVGQDMRSYVNQLRAENAYNLLQENPRPTVQAAALESGFSSMNTFYRAWAKFLASRNENA